MLRILEPSTPAVMTCRLFCFAVAEEGGINIRLPVAGFFGTGVYQPAHGTGIDVLAGAYYDEDEIPEEWRKKIAMREPIEMQAEKIFALAGNMTEG
ncbi:hypothetical protein SEF58_08780 [Neomoorella humiferrea]|uniref:hypothetical protein n=1 Tax=Neomoorella humiferrea TaxID=676965 RepID=UPI003D8F4E06